MKYYRNVLASTTPIIRYDVKPSSHKAYTHQKASAAALELSKDEPSLYGSTSNNYNELIFSQKKGAFLSNEQIKISRPSFHNQAATTAIAVPGESGSLVNKSIHPGLTSSRNLSHLMLSPRGFSVQNKVQLQVMDQKKEQHNKSKQAQVNQAEAIKKMTMKIQQEQQVRATLGEQQRSQDVDRLLLEIRIMELLKNHQQGTCLPTIAIPISKQKHIHASMKMIPDVSRALLNQRSLAPLYQELGIPTPLKTSLDDNISSSTFRPQQQYKSLLNVASHILEKAPNRSMLSMAPLIHAAFNITNAAAFAVNALNPSLIPLSLPVVLGRFDTHRCNLSEHQLLLRQQIEIFEADVKDVDTHMRGRNKSISLGQVGLRCKHCAHVLVQDRRKGSTYFPSTKSGVYQAAQNMSTTHIANGLCKYLPSLVTVKFAIILYKKQSSIVSQKTGSGRQHWTQSVSKLGLIDTEDHGIRFIRNWPCDVGTGNNIVDGLRL